METRQFLSVLLVFALLGGALWALRRGGVVWRRATGIGSPSPFRLAFGRAPGHRRSLISRERLALTPQHSLHLVRIHEREMVVATYPHGCTLLTNEWSQELNQREKGLEA